jgi:hypothetical protein
VLLALLLAGAVVLARHRLAQDPHLRHDRFTLPAFDAYAYMAMADHPAFFTVAPWGYRVLTPWLVHILPVANAARGFRYVTLCGLTLAGGLLFLFLRRLGHGPGAALAGVVAFGLSPPVGEAIRNRFLAEPLGIVLVLAFLLALEAGAGLAVLFLLAVLTALCKEGLLAVVTPLVFFALREREGTRRALVDFAVVSVPAIAVAVGLPAWWTPHLPPSLPRVEPWVAAKAALLAWRDWAAPVLLAGLTPLAVLGALRPQARPLLRRYAYLPAVTFAAALAAATYAGEGGPGHFFAADVPRLLLYALPVVIALALVALDRVWPHLRTPPAVPPLPKPWRAVAALVAVGAAVAPFLAVDRYRRVDLRGARDGPYVLGLCRESLRTAGRLERGQAVSFDAATQRFAWGDSDPGELDRMRWFLRGGWGGLAHYGTGEIVMHEAEATLLVPAFRSRDLDLEVVTEAPPGTRLSITVNGRPVGETEPGGGRTVVTIPTAVLFRGDNLATLSATDGQPGARLRRLGLAPR